MKDYSFRSIICIVATRTGATSSFADANFGTVINLAGKQRMLTQKMSKEILLASYDPSFANYYQGASETAALFDTTLNGLQNGSEDMGLPGTESARILRQIDKVRGLWEPFHAAVSKISESESATQEDLDLIVSTNGTPSGDE